MAKIKKYFLVVLMAFVALVLVGCGDSAPVELPAPTEVTVNYDIYDGSESDPYLLVGSVMYLSATVNEGADATVTWSLAATDRAELVEEDGSAVITGKVPGDIEVTCTSVKDPSVKQTVKIEVVLSNDFNAILTQAIAEIKSKLPVYVAGDFELPKLDNDNISVTYLSKLKNVWDDGMFDYEEAYEGSDLEYQFTVKLAYRGVSSEAIIAVRVVSDVENNAFTNLEAAQAEVAAFMADYTAEVFNENAKGAAEGASASWNDTGKPAVMLPTSTTDKNGNKIKIYWEMETIVGGTLELKKYEVAGEDAKYYLAYAKGLIDETYKLSAFFQLNDKLVKDVYYVTCDGYDPEEIVAYFLETNQTIPNVYELTKSFITLNAVDTKKEFQKISVEYAVEDGTIAKLTPVEKTSSTGVKTIESYRLQGLKSGTTTLTATFYYGKTANIVMKDVLDENGNPVKDETGAIVQEETIEYSYRYAYEYKIELTVKK